MMKSGRELHDCLQEITGMRFRGKGISDGLALGTLKRLGSNPVDITRTKADNADEEIARFEEARNKSREQLKELYSTAKELVGEKEASVFKAHLLIMDDSALTMPVMDMIRDENASVEYAVLNAKNRLKEKIGKLDMPFMQERKADIEDVCNRILSNVCALPRDVVSFCQGLTEDTILLADDIMPSEVINLDHKKVTAVVLRKGTEFTHAAILAKAMGLIMLLNVDYPDDIDGKPALIDSRIGLLVTDPGKRDIYLAKRYYQNSAEEGTAKFMRSEYLVLKCGTVPDEEDQFKAYRDEILSSPKKSAVIRAFDLGSDKVPGFDFGEKEPNPAMGLRGIRYLMKHPEIMDTQLRAILRASAWGEAKILFPMIISMSEVRWIKRKVKEACEALKKDNIPYGKYNVGVMIETPAAVAISGKIAKEVDFMWIGMNDLTQFTLAIDRQNPELKELFDPSNEAVRRLIDIVFENGKLYDCDVDVCS